MCGIAGAFNWAEPTDLQRMLHVLAHRGPDDDGIWHARLEDGAFIGMGSRRLAILDLSPAGHMPMSNADGTVWIAHNGEIYNFKELRQELEAKGHRFGSNTDTEVILRLYEELGPQCVRRLEGMFAFAIWDHRVQQLLLARDGFGVKPLYYAHQGDRLAFASEVKALLQLPGMRRSLDLEALHQYLTLLWVPDPNTLFSGIRKLPPGHYALYRRGDLQLTRFWDLTFPPAGHCYKASPGELAEELRMQLRRSVQAQMVSDVPIGAFLSSGMDSTTIVAFMAEASVQPVSTHTITFPPDHRRGENAIDDASIAARVAQRFGCKHTQITVRPDVADLLPRLTWHMDDPVGDPAIIPAYLVCRQARETTKVLLSGVGGDELFAGYRKHVAHRLSAYYQMIPAALRKYFLEPLVLSFPAMRGTPLKGYVRLAKKMARSGSLPPRERFLMDSTYLSDAQKMLLYTPELAAELGNADPWGRHLESFDAVRESDFLNQMLYVDTKTFMVSLNLNYNDKMSMASSVEVRVPFLDRGLAEFAAWQIPPDLKVHGQSTKYILRQAMASHLPGDVLNAPKAGFGAPVDYWLAGELRPMVDDLLSPESLKRRGLLNPGFVRHLVQEQRSGRQDWSLQIWSLLSLELWLRTFIDAAPIPAARVETIVETGH